MSAATDDLRFLPAHAADLIDRVGWTQGTDRDGAGRVCLTGALRYCDPQPGDWLIAREIFRAKGRAEGWNDASERTCNEVVELLRSTEITDAELAQTFGPSWETVVNLVHTAATITPLQVLDLTAAWDAVWDAAWDAARDAARGAARDAVWSAAGSAARDAARDAVWDAVWGAAGDAAWDAARDAAWDAAWDAARDAARDAVWDAARDAVWSAAGSAVWDAARDAARDAAWDAARDAAWGAARDAVWDAVWGAVTRDLIGQYGYTQDHYDTLTRPWREALGRLHPDDADLRVAAEATA